MNYHELLGVAPDASNEEIRAAWQQRIAEVEPSDWRFAAYNEALTELTRKPEPEPDPEHEPEPAEVEQEVSRLAPLAPQPPKARWVPPAWLLGVLAVLAAVCVAVAAVAFSKPSPQGIEDDARAAQSAAETAIVPVLSYDYRDLASGEKSAEAYLDPTYRTKKYAPYFKLVRKNAPGLQSVVSVTVIDSSIVRADEDRVQVLVLFDQSTTNKSRTTPLVNQDHATLTMEKSGDGWLVSDITT